MRIKILIAIFNIFLLQVATCLAMKPIDVDRAALGGITIGSSADYIKSIYGNPNKIKTDHDITWYYGDTFQIRFTNDKVTSIISSGNNGLMTPDGVGVGMKKGIMRSTYGKPSHVDKYDSRAIYSYNIGDNFNMSFLVRDGMIFEIRIF